MCCQDELHSKPADTLSLFAIYLYLHTVAHISFAGTDRFMLTINFNHAQTTSAYGFKIRMFT